MKTKPSSKTLILIFIISIIAQSCRFIDNEPYPLNQSSRIIEEVIPLNNFDRVKMGNAFRVFIRKGSKFSIIAKGDKNDVNDLEAKVIDGELNIKYHNNIKKRYEMIFYITMPTFDCGSFYGAAYAEIYNFNENNISIFGSGASTIYIDSDSKYWDVKLSGASDLEMVGFGKSLDLEISGASKVHAPDLNLNNIDLNVSGSSNAWIFANKEINGKASGASQIICSGNASINVKLTGASRLDRN